MEVVITARVLYHDRLGKLVRDRKVDVPEQQAADWLRRGFAVRAATAELSGRPSLAAGTPSSALPAAPASPQTTSSESAPGGKRRRRKSPEASS